MSQASIPTTENRFSNLVIRASAGTGKTYQLSNRFIGLLARGIPPDEVLATTFTRKAAGEIFDRVMFRLADAATSETRCAELAGAIKLPSFNSKAALALLATTTRSLHRLRIGTLDSFFIQLAGNFALELGLPPGWRIVEPLADELMREEAVERVLSPQQEDGILTIMHMLTKGEALQGINRLILSLTSSLYDVYREAGRPAWEKITRRKTLQGPEVAELVLQLSGLPRPSHKSFEAGFQADLRRATAEDWKEFVSKGIAQKVIEQEFKYYTKPIDPAMVDLYQKLIHHAEGVIINQLADQTLATRDLLDRFEQEYKQLKTQQRALRFDEVTRSVAAGIGQVQAADSAFRMDGHISHLLLDEFQDTSLAQWQVLRPLAHEITSRPISPSGQPQSLFCVGDVKQAIYGWRGGLAEIFEAVTNQLPNVKTFPLNQSYRSSRFIMQATNEVFQRMTRHPQLDNYTAAVASWSEAFPEHSTAKGELPGYVSLETAPAPVEGEAALDAVLAYTVEQVQQAVANAPHCTIGVLCRRNDVVANLIFLLRKAGLPASEEGGNPLTDSAPVEVVLSALRLADHPGHSICRFHLAHSPLGELWNLRPDNYHWNTQANTASQAIRESLQSAGYGETVYAWAKVLAPHCNQRDLNRLQQLVEAAYSFDKQSTLRSDDFVALVETSRVADPVSAKIRVMSIHQAKGLEFDIVFLPELDGKLAGSTPLFVTGRKEPGEPVDTVCRYAGKKTGQPFLSAKLQDLFEEDTVRRVHEGLCVLYVAMTRAVHAMHLIIPPSNPSEKTLPKKHSALLRAALVGPGPVGANEILWECGDRQWYLNLAHPAPQGQQPLALAANATRLAPANIPLAPPAKIKSRGLLRAAPSAREGGHLVSARQLLTQFTPAGAQYGTLFHAWLEQVQWLEEGGPSDQTLRGVAARLASEIGDWANKLDIVLPQFRAATAAPAILAALSRSYYAQPTHLGPAPAIRQKWQPKAITLEAKTEFSFALRQENQLVPGSIDRLVLIYSGGKLVAADVLDYKTDTIAENAAASSENSLVAKVEYYRPQLAAYQQCVAQLFGLTAEQVSARLLFLSVGQVVSLT